ncbi:MAG: response regulator [Promethearchaeota archaeon]
MASLILVIDDNKDILFYVKLILESHGFNVETAENGKEALQILSKVQGLPDLIVSDIMMPEMDGYELFKTISSDPRWNSIPFVFLTARSSPEDIRLGKILGVDDYIVKPIKEKDLIAIAKGKISRHKTSNNINKKLAEKLKELDISFSPSISQEEAKLVVLLVMFWHEAYGPEFLKYYPTNVDLPFSIEDIGFQLFNVSNTIYGEEHELKAEALLLNIENIKMHGFVYFDAYQDYTTKKGHKQYMLAVIAPKINYFETLQIKDVFKDLFNQIKTGSEWDEEKYIQDIVKILSTSNLFEE